jgi:integrase/recombinase XerD
MSKKRQRKPLPPIGDVSDKLGMQHLMDEHKAALEVRNYSPSTISGREKYLRWFASWCVDRGITRPGEVTKPVLERYQRHLYHYRTADDKPISFRSQYSHLSHVKAWFKWLARENRILFNPASELELPKVGRRLPKAVLSAKEADAIMAQADLSDPHGIRDRAILEVFYSCGIRRKELAELQLYDVDAERKTLMVRQGKGKKDRLIPIGNRALQWITVYLETARPLLLCGGNEQTLFLSNIGGPLEPDSLTEYVRHYIDAADIGKRGSCHLFRHTMATLMLENGADIRYIQAMLGHAQLSTTEIYTQVSIKKLQQIHGLTHPADNPKPNDDEATEPDNTPDADASSSKEIEPPDDDEEPPAPVPR